jgi:hypothetical protein
LSCPLEETADHQHTEDCYKYEKVLICGKEAHTHTPECFGEDASELSYGAEGTEAVEEGFKQAGLVWKDAMGQDEMPQITKDTQAEITNRFNKLYEQMGVNQTAKMEE